MFKIRKTGCLLYLNWILLEKISRNRTRTRTEPKPNRPKISDSPNRTEPKRFRFGSFGDLGRFRFCRKPNLRKPVRFWRFPNLRTEPTRAHPYLKLFEDLWRLFWRHSKTSFENFLKTIINFWKLFVYFCIPN